MCVFLKGPPRVLIIFLRIAMLSLQFFLDFWLKTGTTDVPDFPLSDLQHQLWSALTLPNSWYCLTVYKGHFCMYAGIWPKMKSHFLQRLWLLQLQRIYPGESTDTRMSVMDLRCKGILHLISTWHFTYKYQITFIPNPGSIFKYSWIIVFFCQKMWCVVESMIQNSYSFLLLI